MYLVVLLYPIFPSPLPHRREPISWICVHYTAFLCMHNNVSLVFLIWNATELSYSHIRFISFIHNHVIIYPECLSLKFVLTIPYYPLGWLSHRSWIHSPIHRHMVMWTDLLERVPLWMFFCTPPGTLVYQAQLAVCTFPLGVYLGGNCWVLLHVNVGTYKGITNCFAKWL